MVWSSLTANSKQLSNKNKLKNGTIEGGVAQRDDNVCQPANVKALIPAIPHHFESPSFLIIRKIKNAQAIPKIATGKRILNADKPKIQINGTAIYGNNGDAHSENDSVITGSKFPW